MQVLIRQARVLDPRSDVHNQTVDIWIEDGIVQKIAPSLDVNANTVIEAEGLCVSSGWTDVFADYREPGYEHKETIDTGLAAAAAGGFTNVFLAPNTAPTLSNKAAIQYIVKKAMGNVVNAYPFGTATRDADGKELAEMMDMKDHGAIAFTDGWKTIQNTNLMLKALEYVNAFNGTLVQIPVDAALAAGGLMHEGPVSTRLGMAGIPVLAEALIIHRDIELLRYTNSRLHLTGISSMEGVEMIRKAKAEGLNITCSVTPYHLALNDEMLKSYDSMYKVSPPLRSEADRQALIAGLNDGTIDCIATHHRPQEWDAKAKEFEYASDGMNIQEIAFPLLWDAVKEQVGIDRIIDAFVTKPQAIFGLASITLKVNSPASLTFFSTALSSTLTNKDKKSLGINNPFIGKKLDGKVLGIINNNQLYVNA